MTKPTIIAQRGSSADHPGNSRAAFEAARSDGADAVEYDVMPSADGTLIVRHDPTLAGRPVAGMPLADILRAAPDTVLLDDHLDWCRRTGMAGLLEVTNGRVVEPLAALLATAPVDGLTVGSFLGAALDALKARVSGLRTSLMIGSLLNAEVMARLAARFRCDGVNLCWRGGDSYPHVLLTVPKVSALRDHGLSVTLWNEERPEELRPLIALGADAICTDCPAVLRLLLDGPTPPATVH